MIFIQRFVASQAQDVIDLILTIQQIEFGVPVTAADQPDLLDIPSYYFIGEGNFWVACLDGKVVGTIGLLDFGGGGFALRKMFVAKANRGMELGIAQKLWKTALDWVSGHKGREVYLGTVELLKAAHRFYEKNGFTRIDAGQLPGRFPRMAVDTVFYVFKV